MVEHLWRFPAIFVMWHCLSALCKWSKTVNVMLLVGNVWTVYKRYAPFWPKAGRLWLYLRCWDVCGFGGWDALVGSVSAAHLWCLYSSLSLRLIYFPPLFVFVLLYSLVYQIEMAIETLQKSEGLSSQRSSLLNSHVSCRRTALHDLLSLACSLSYSVPFKRVTWSIRIITMHSLHKQS